MPDDKKPDEDDGKPDPGRRDKREPKYYIQQLLGHEKLETTAIYTELSTAQLKAIHAESHPAEKRKHIDPTGDSGARGV